MGGAVDGIIPSVIDSLHNLIDEKRGRGAGGRRGGGTRLDFKIGVQYVEIADEKFLDLLSPQRCDAVIRGRPAHPSADSSWSTIQTRRRRRDW